MELRRGVNDDAVESLAENGVAMLLRGELSPLRWSLETVAGRESTRLFERMARLFLLKKHKNMWTQIRNAFQKNVKNHKQKLKFKAEKQNVN